MTEIEFAKQFPAFPSGQYKLGMTIRDYFIAHIGDENQGGDEHDYSFIVKEKVVGRPAPNGDKDGWLAVMQFEADFRAAWRVMRANAMLLAREA